MYRRPLRSHNLHPLLRRLPPLPRLHRRRWSPPNCRHRRSRNSRQAPLLPRLRRSPLQRCHVLIPRLCRQEYGESQLLDLGRSFEDDLLRDEGHLGSQHRIVCPVCV
jgi:hypothetical protein